MQYEIVASILAVAVSILAGAILATWQLREMTRALERVITTIHEDIKASQKKLERKLKEK